jgi:hypothetical protein
VMKRRGLRGVTLFLAISASVVSACISVLLMAGEYHSARFNLDTYDREYQGWEACRLTNPAYYADNKEAVSSCLTSLKAARDNFWLRRSTIQLAGMFIIAGLSSAAGGYVTAWGLVRLVGMGFHGFVRWLSLRFSPRPKKPLDSQSHLQPDISTEY